MVISTSCVRYTHKCTNSYHRITLILKNIKTAIILRQVLIRSVLFSLLLFSTFTDSYLEWKSERMRSTESVRLLRKICVSFNFLQRMDTKVCQVPYLSYVSQPPLLPQLWLAIASPKSASVTNFTLFLCTYPIQLTQYLCPLLTVWTPLMQINTRHRCGWKPALNRRWKMWNGCQVSTVRVGQTVLLRLWFNSSIPSVVRLGCD